MDHNGQVVFCSAAKDGWSERRRIVLPNLGWAQHLQFSPGDGRLVLLACDAHGGAIMIVDGGSGEGLASSTCVRWMLLPPSGIRFRYHAIFCVNKFMQMANSNLSMHRNFPYLFGERVCICSEARSEGWASSWA